MRESETSTRCSIYLCIHWLLLLSAMARENPVSLGLSGRHSKQLSYPARAVTISLDIHSRSLFTYQILIEDNVKDNLLKLFLFSSLTELKIVSGTI